MFLLEKIIFAFNHLVDLEFPRLYKSHRLYLFVYNYAELLLCKLGKMNDNSNGDNNRIRPELGKSTTELSNELRLRILRN